MIQSPPKILPFGGRLLCLKQINWKFTISIRLILLIVFITTYVNKYTAKDAGTPQRNMMIRMGILRIVRFNSPSSENISSGPIIGCRIAVSLFHSSGSDVGIVKSLAYLFGI